MNRTETASYLRWLAQADGRIQVTDPNIQIWQSALANAATDEVLEATLEFTRINDNVMVSPAAIRRMAFAVREREVARSAAAIAAPAPQRNPLSWRQKNPDEWDRLFEAGRISWRQRHGLEP